MELYIAGGAGEHGRNSFYVQLEKKSFLVDCGLMAGNPEDPYPHLCQEQIDRTDIVFLTHSHADHSGALPWLAEQGFCGRVIASDKTLRQLPWEIPKSITLESICPNGQGEYQGLSISWGRSGHCPGSVWYQLSKDGKSIFFSGDYVEDTQVYVSDLIRGRKADLAVIDCACGKNKTSYESACYHLVDKTEELLTSCGLLFIPVPKYGRGLEILKLLSDHLENISYFADESFLKQAEKAKKDCFWHKPVNIDVSLKHYKGEKKGIVFISNSQLRTEAAKKMAEEIIALGGRGLMTGTVEKDSFSAVLLAERTMEFASYPIHLNYRQYLKLKEKNHFAKTIPCHSADFPIKEDRFYI